MSFHCKMKPKNVLVPCETEKINKSLRPHFSLRRQSFLTDAFTRTISMSFFLSLRSWTLVVEFETATELENNTDVFTHTQEWGNEYHVSPHHIMGHHCDDAWTTWENETQNNAEWWTRNMNAIWLLKGSQWKVWSQLSALFGILSMWPVWARLPDFHSHFTLRHINDRPHRSIRMSKNRRQEQKPVSLWSMNTNGCVITNPLDSCWQEKFDTDPLINDADFLWTWHEKNNMWPTPGTFLQQITTRFSSFTCH